MKNTSVIIVTYNGMKWIKRCIESILDNSIISKIIVVDNSSTDKTTIFIKENFPEVILLEQTKNLGFGAANNLGITYALKNNYDFIFLLNQDAYVQLNCIEKLIEVYKNNSDYGILSPIHLNGNGKSLDKNFSQYIKTNDTLFYDALKNDYTKTIYEIPFINAAAWLLPRATLETVGGFDPIFFHYSEDDNYCQRVIYHGYKIGVVPTSYINHDREFRPLKEKFSNYDKILLRERYLKLKWANINYNFDSEVLTTKRKLRILIPKLLIKCEFKNANYYIKELALINKIMPEINKSREINKRKESHYI